MSNLQAPYLTKKRVRNNLNSPEINIKFFNKDDNKLFLSLIQNSVCYFCHKRLNEEDLIQCVRCFKKFHKQCYPGIEDFYLNNNICLCLYEKNNICYKCQSPFENEKNKIIVQCEFCGNKFHLECSLISLFFIFKREYYNKLLNEYKNGDCYKNFLESIFHLDIKKINREYSKVDFLYDLLKKSGFDDEISKKILNNLFYLCDFCKNKKNKKINSIVYQSTLVLTSNYQEKTGNLHQLLIPSTILQIQGNYYEQYIPIKKIIGEYFYNDLSRKHYLIKWENNTFSIELDEFIQNLNNFEEKYEEFKNFKFENNFFPNQNEYYNHMNNYQKINNEININFKLRENQFILVSNEKNKEIYLYLNELIKFIFKNNKFKPKILIFSDNNSNINKFINNIFSINKNIGLIENNLEEIVFESICYNKENKINF